MPFVNPVRNPFETRQCPFCFEKYHLGDCAVWSSINNVEMVPVPKNIWEKGVRRFVPTRLIGSKKYVFELARRKCPFCGMFLPLNMDYRHVENYIISIVGAGRAGKSHYIASLINDLRSYGQYLIGYSQFEADGPSQQNYNNVYYQPLYIQKDFIPSTQNTYNPLREPLVYQMLVPAPGPEATVRNVNLLFYDAAGEQIVNEQDFTLYSRYLFFSSAIIFLADPLAMDGIVNQLPFHLRPDPQAVGGPSGVDKAIDVLNGVLARINRLRGQEPGSQLPIPLAITLSKSDILRSVQGLANQPHFLDRAPTFYQRTALLNDLNHVSNDVYRFLQRYGDPPLLYANSRARDVAYFAISATGHPLQSNNKYPAVEPVRCLDPLLWILWKLGILVI